MPPTVEAMLEASLRFTGLVLREFLADTGVVYPSSLSCALDDARIGLVRLRIVPPGHEPQAPAWHQLHPTSLFHHLQHTETGNRLRTARPGTGSCYRFATEGRRLRSTCDAAAPALSSRRCSFEEQPEQPSRKLPASTRQAEVLR